MKNRKEYNNRLDAKLVNPFFTIEECEANRVSRAKTDAEICNQFEKMLSDSDAAIVEYWAVIRQRSETNERSS